MVHIPILGVDVPEPRLQHVIPDAIAILLRVCSGLLDAAMDTLYPLDGPAQDEYAQAVVASIPREFDKVIQRFADGKIKNEEQLSSEAQEASFDWYRRMIRTSVAGATDELTEDVLANKLGLSKPSMQQQVLQRHFQDCQFNLLMANMDDEGNVDENFAELAALDEADQVWVQRQLANSEAMSQSKQAVEKRVRHRQRQGAQTVANAGVGFALGMLVLKSTAFAWRLIKQRKGKRTVKGKRVPSGSRPSTSGAATKRAPSATQTPAAAAMPAGASQQPAATPQAQPAAAPARRPRASTTSKRR